MKWSPKMKCLDVQTTSSNRYNMKHVDDSENMHVDIGAKATKISQKMHVHVYCVVPENIHTPPTEGFFLFQHPPL